MSQGVPARAADAPVDVVDLFGVPIQNCTTRDALARLARFLHAPERQPRAVFFVNANTLNLACASPAYRGVLCSADQVFGDGTGVRWAVRLVHGVGMIDNVNGTDLVPELLRRPPGHGLRYYLLGARPEAIARAAAHAAEAFPGWTLVGHHHGYVTPEASGDVIDAIDAARPELLLVGMGNPRQEDWIAANLKRLRVPLVMGVGGLFDYWAGDLDRAPRWMRWLGVEWVHLLLRQPRKARRYLLGNPLFLGRALVQRRAARHRTKAAGVVSSDPPEPAHAEALAPTRPGSGRSGPIRAGLRQM
jgi:N-acetylglucosaminyldiphosphoundecaprenol N-acetyl-beta-D-mannosaminyltransferase